MPHINKDPAVAGGASLGCSDRNELIVNNQTKPPPQGSWKSAAIGTLDNLRERFPPCFVEPQPLKIGIRADIIDAMPELPKADISHALKFHVTRTGYLQRCIEGATRIDLTGEPAGIVSASEAANAQRWLSKRREGRPQPAPSPRSPPQRLTLAALKESAAKRKLEMSGA